MALDLSLGDEVSRGVVNNGKAALQREVGCILVDGEGEEKLVDIAFTTLMGAGWTRVRSEADRQCGR